MASRSILILRHPWKFLKFSWAYLRYLLLALADRLLFPFACRPISLHTETARCYLGASLSCFVELIFSAPPGLGPDDFEAVKLKGVPAVLVPPGKKLETLSRQTERTVVLLYAHGGGYAFGEALMYIDAYKRWIREAEANGLCLIIVSVDYRLTTTAKFPAYRSDFIDSYRSLLFDYGIPAAKIFFGGDSAGGNLSAISAIHARNTGLPQPAGLILLSPWLDLTHAQTLDSPAMRTDFLVTFSVANPMLVESLLPETMVATDPQISPVYDDLSTLPPQIVFAGGAEVLLPDAKDWVRRSREAGNTVQFVLDPGQVHMYPMGRPFCNEAMERKTNKRLIGFINETTSRLATKVE
ncbi:Alpha/Beta hydrolase protein [Hyaloscypha sp. PMI_1271]|nr:Alpha/Beta hydrolase protein [Hyaloscypha sp. PMI_1271]